MLQGSGDARMQPLYFLITTAGNDTNSICYEVHQKAIDIAEGRKVDPTFYSVIYGADESEDWTDPAVWKKANPSLGITVGIDKVKAACESAQQNPGEENAFRQLRLLFRRYMVALIARTADRRSLVRGNLLHGMDTRPSLLQQHLPCRHCARFPVTLLTAEDSLPPGQMHRLRTLRQKLQVAMP